MTLFTGAWRKGSGPQPDPSTYRFWPGAELAPMSTGTLARGSTRAAWRFSPGGPDEPTVVELSRRRALVVVGFTEARFEDPEEASASILARLGSAEGEFVALLCEPERDRATLINDRFAARPLYLAATRDGLVWSTHIGFLPRWTDVPLRLDPLGVLQMFQLSHTLGGQTQYEGVERMRPATILGVDGEGAETRSHWRLRHDPDDGLDPDLHAERAFQAIYASTQARAKGRCGFVSLSGGLDSRLVAGCVPPARFFSVTRRTPAMYPGEVEVATLVATRLGLEHRVEALHREDVSENVERLACLTGAVTPANHGLGLIETIEQMREYGGFKLGGGPGDVLAGSYVPSLLHTRPELCEALLDQFARERLRFSRLELAQIFRSEVLDACLPRVLDRLRSSLAAMDGPTAAHRITAWAMVHRQPAFTFSSPIAAHPLVSEASPHLGHGWTQAMLALPATWLFRRSFYAYLVRRSLPAVADVIYANTGEPLPATFTPHQVPARGRRRDRGRSLLRSALKLELVTRAAPTLRRHVARAGRGRFGNYRVLADDRALLARVRDGLDAPMLKDLVDRRRAHEYLGRVQRGELFSLNNADHGELLGALVTIAVGAPAVARL